METIELNGVRVTYPDTPEAHKAVFDHLMTWFHSHQCYSGESVAQSDRATLSSIEMLCDLADDVIGFEVEYDDDL